MAFKQSIMQKEKYGKHGKWNLELWPTNRPTDLQALKIVSLPKSNAVYFLKHSVYTYFLKSVVDGPVERFDAETTKLEVRRQGLNRKVTLAIKWKRRIQARRQDFKRGGGLRILTRKLFSEPPQIGKYLGRQRFRWGANFSLIFFNLNGVWPLKVGR